VTGRQAVAIVLAAGTGSRFGGERPKQLLPLLGRPVLIHSLEQHTRLGHHVIAVVSESLVDEITGHIRAHLPDAEVHLEVGGSTRRESVLAGIDAIPDEIEPDAAVLLRNAASPNTPDELIEGVIGGIGEHDGMQAFVRSNETTFVRANANLDWVISRDITGFTVDPTAYRRSLVERIAKELDDESGETTLDIARRLGANIGLVESPRSNIKLTTADDLGRLLVYMDPRPSEY
jgi:2-C-methyl-D-erythritol 4-phosphate cytidylyltransferase